MNLVSLLSAFLAAPLSMPEEPNPAMLRIGAEVLAKKRPIDATIRRESVSLGKWSDGKRLQNVESVIWLSPDLLGRWLGYLKAKEFWTDEQLGQRWLKLRAQTTGKLIFVVQIASLEKQDPYEMGDLTRPDDRGIENVQLRWTSGSTVLPATEQFRAEFYSRNPFELLKTDWFATYAGFEAIRPADTKFVEPEYPLGWNRKMFIVTTIDISAVAPGNRRIELTVLSKGKTRKGQMFLVRG